MTDLTDGKGLCFNRPMDTDREVTGMKEILKHSTAGRVKLARLEAQRAARAAQAKVMTAKELYLLNRRGVRTTILCPQTRREERIVRMHTTVGGRIFIRTTSHDHTVDTTRTFEVTS